MWSLGVLLYTLFSGHFPFQASSMEALGRKVMRGKPDTPLSASEAGQDLVQGMLMVRGEQRISIEQLCAHRWITSSNQLPPVEAGGAAETPWDEAAAAQLQEMGCPVELVKHHLTHDSRNHVVAAYEILLRQPLVDDSGGRPEAQNER